MDDSPESFARKILDAMPLMVFVVDDDVRVHHLNQAAAAAFGPNGPGLPKRRGGEVLHCLHAADVPEGCGRGPFCQSCVIRNSVTSCLRGQVVTRQRTTVSWLLDEKKTEFDLLITAAPLPDGDRPLALLIVEDISEMSRLREIIPICANCKRIRDDQQYWQSVEAYFKDHIGVEFTHGLCPTCVDELYPEHARGPRQDDPRSPP